MDRLRSAADQRRLLAETIRRTARWRGMKAAEHADAPQAAKRSRRAQIALRALANFVDGLGDDDPDLDLYALRRVAAASDHLLLSDESRELLSRFGMSRGAWQQASITQAQMRNLLRRLDGVEARERRARKLRAEAGYGDE
jgi:hypothetical protein